MKLLIQNLSKKYKGNKYGLIDFSLEIGNGILGLLGPNGAGKSTLMRIIATISKPTTGMVQWNGVDIVRSPDEIRKVLGYLPQDFGIYPNLTPAEFLEYIAAIKGVSGKSARQRIDALLDEMNLTHVRNKPIGSFSGGMRQRVGIAQVLINDPKMLVLDEPTVGLDPEERVRFRNLLSHLSGERIVILSSHIVTDIETIAGDIAIICQGRLLARGLTDQMTARVEGRVFEALIGDQALADFKQKHLVNNFIRRPEGWLVRYISKDAGVASEPSSTRTAATLEDAYLHMTSEAKEGRPYV